MDEYIKNKLKNTRTRELTFGNQLILQHLKPIKKIKRDTIFQQKISEQLAQIGSKLKKLQQKIANSKNNEDALILEKPSTQKSCRETVLSERTSQKPDNFFQQTQKLEGVERMAIKRKSLYIRAPNQISSSQQSQSSNINAQQQQFIPKP